MQRLAPRRASRPVLPSPPRDLPAAGPSRRGVLAAGVGSLALAPALVPATASAAAPTGRGPGAPAPVDEARAVGPAPAAGGAVCLVEAGSGWLLQDASGATTATTGLEGAALAGLAATASGLLVAGGWSTQERLAGYVQDADRAQAAPAYERRFRAAVWTSTDGLAWRQLHLDDSALDTKVGAVAAGPGEQVLAAVVTETDGAAGRVEALLWSSPSGAPARAALPVGQVRCEALASGPDGWVAALVGTDGTRFASSTDGLRWRLGASADGLAVAGLAVAGPAVAGPAGGGVLVGNDVADGTPVVGRLTADGATWRPARRPPGWSAVGVAVVDGRERTAWQGGGTVVVVDGEG
jgi:hypothetical protein